jgi:hypothetical protein
MNGDGERHRRESVTSMLMQDAGRPVFIVDLAAPGEAIAVTDEARIHHRPIDFAAGMSLFC